MARKKRVDTKGRVLQVGELQEKSGRYRYQYTTEEGKRLKIRANTLLELRELEKEIQRDSLDGIKRGEYSKVKLNDIFDIYIAGKTNLKQSTRTNYKYMYNKYCRDSIGNRHIVDIKFTHIKTFYNYLLNEGGFKANSLDIINTILHPTFQMAVRDDIIRKNPTDEVMAEIKKSNLWDKPKRHALTVEQQELFIKHTAESPIYAHWLPLFTAFLGTGCRVGEIIGLRWSDCDFENNTISINHNLIYRQQPSGKCEMHITTPKTEAGTRIVPMLSDVKKALLEEKKAQMKRRIKDVSIDSYNGFIFRNRDGSVHNPMAINRAIERIRIEANQEEEQNAKKEKREAVIIPHFSCHHLRHTFCTRFCENESNIKVIQEIMGHSDISTTMNIYAEATESKKKEAFCNLEGKIKIS